ncbi:hypothetical protein ACTFIZ_007851 [Dictyostelium cf. discoideum]
MESNSLTNFEKSDLKIKNNGNAIQRALEVFFLFKEALDKQNEKEKLAFKKIMIEMSINNSLLYELLASFSIKANTIDVEIIILESQISTIERLTLENKKEIQSNDQEKIKEINSMIDDFIDPLLKNIDGLTNKFKEKSVDDEELKKKIDGFFENSKKLIESFDKESKSQFKSKLLTLVGGATSIIGIGGTTAIGATEVVGVTSLIAVGATSISMVAPFCAPLLLIFGLFASTFISFYNQSVSREKKMQALKTLLSYYMDNIELISQIMDETTRLIYFELKEKVLEFKKLKPNLKIDFDLTLIKDQFKSISSNQKLLREKIEEIANYQLDLIQECENFRNISLKNKTINKK